MGNLSDGLGAAADFQRARSAERSADSARSALQDWKSYAVQLTEALKDSQIDAARQAVIKEECLRELFLLNPAHRLHVTANRIDVANKGVRAKLIEMELPALADETDRIIKKTPG